jgi:Tol biopolymer transport system component
MASILGKKGFFLSIILLTALIFCSGRDTGSSDGENSIQEPLIDFEGRIVFQSNFDGDNEIYLLDKSRLTKLTDNTWQDQFPVWSPDGKQIAFSADSKGNFDIFIMNADGSGIQTITSEPEDEGEPAWFPGGNRLAFSRESKRLLRDRSALYVIDLSSGREQRLIPEFSSTHGIPHISPVESLVLFTGKRRMGWDAALYNLDTHEIRFIGDAGKSCRGRFSRDGKSIAFVSSSADGKGDIWLITPDGREERRLTIRDETYDYFPSWSPDGRFIVYNSSRQHDHDGDWSLYLLNVSTGESRLLFDSPGNDVFPDWILP